MEALSEHSSAEQQPEISYLREGNVQMITRVTEKFEATSVPLLNRILPANGIPPLNRARKWGPNPKLIPPQWGFIP